MSMRFKDKVAIVTGSGQGIGEVYARMLAAEGAAVVVAEINEEKGRAVADDIVAGGGKARFIRVDVSDAASCLAMAEESKKALGNADYLVNNAAIFHGMKFETLMSVDLAYYERFMAVNMNGALFVTRAVGPQMIEKGKGSIVNQSSAAAYMAGPSHGYYGIAKLATNSITMHLAQELGPKGIRVNGIAPGPTDTEAMRNVAPEIIERVVGQIPLGRLAKAEEQAEAVLFLLSDAASYITGQTLQVDGGQIRRP